MAAKGSIAKNTIINKILETFPENSFIYNDGKEVRINMTENGELVQIKLTFTAAKVPVEVEGVSTFNNEDIPPFDMNTPISSTTITPKVEIPQEPTEEEKQRIIDIMASLGV